MIIGVLYKSTSAGAALHSERIRAVVAMPRRAEDFLCFLVA